ncbi:MAG: putative selenium-dependent hydroxylase accessory protein YqeC [Proteobacteria bacterium]|nr:putative selenium-dependent hydroxylase accessory protein YqeC [Pseudomonadota bacterium]MBU1057499.1 putative selenium-dependent hydroxylase accessory protein YqeC [Pseudomonadota bacterium]
MHSIIHTLNIKQKGILSFVGAGGKTTLMFRIAEELARADRRILVTTTTKIFAPDKKKYPHLLVTKSKQDLQDRAEMIFRRSNLIVAASHHCPKTNKLIGFSPEVVDSLWQSGCFRWILVEADGSARKPIKAPGEHEPVIPRYTRYLFGLIGLQGLGKPLDEHYVHRVKQFQEITGLAVGSDIELSAITALVNHKNGLFKKCPGEAQTIVFMNQADTLPNPDVRKSIVKQMRQSLLDMADIVAIGQADKADGIIEAYCKASLKESL